MRTNIQKIEYDPNADVIRCGDLFTHEYYVKNMKWPYVAQMCGIRPMNKAYKNIEIQTISFDGKVVGSVIEKKRIGNYCGTKEQNKKLSDLLGMPPKKYTNILKMKQYEAWVKGKEDLIYKLCFGYGGWDIKRISLMNKHYKMIRQYQLDGLDNLVPIAFITGKSTKEMKETCGKSVWKSLCKNTFHRNKLISNILSVKNIKDHLLFLNEINSSVLYFIRKQYSGTYESLVWANNVLKKKRLLTRAEQYLSTMCHIYFDTERMAKQLGYNFNPNWSEKKMNEKHKEYTHLIEKNKYSDEFIPCLKEIIKEYRNEEYPGFKAILLDSAYKIKMQGVAQRHCVASYINNVRLGSYLVYDIQDKENKTSSTLGILRTQMVDNSTKIEYDSFKFSQQYASCNKSVGDIEKNFGLELIKELNKNENVDDRSSIIV